MGVVVESQVILDPGEHIPEVLRDAGFQLVLEQFDFLNGRIAHELLEGTYATQNRGMFVGVKADDSAPQRSS